ncbi:hypothetical protein PVAND_004764 [Polypedilum vanderplanki]|uniref:Uncharacterized protein n=1 Tax=Polypedilum vanderplanki TaxID=319348 RepID=A0A9J6BXX5_POLVA|nr:hypothetical protein PVAND_004764 [Polypedilum vanderplanki]
MNFKALICLLIIIIPLIDGKRSFGITGRRNKSKSPSVRRGQHGHDGDDHIPVPKPPPSHADSKKNIGWNHQQSHPQPSAPQLPGQTGMHHNQGLYGANNRAQPPPYSSYGAAPPAYGSHSANYGVPPPSYGQSMGYGHNQPSYGGFNSYGSMGSPMMGSPMMMPAYGGNYNRGSSFGSGIMTNLFAGLAGYQLAKAFSGGSHHRDREVIIYDNRQLPSNADETATATPQQPVGPISNPSAPHSEAIPNSHDHHNQHQFHQSSSTEIPQLATQITPTNNEYNYWGLPQYGVPLYGFNLPSQITDYYKVESIKPSQIDQQFSS